MSPIAWALLLMMIAAWISGALFIRWMWKETHGSAWLIWVVGYPIAAGAVLWLIRASL